MIRLRITETDIAGSVTAVSAHIRGELVGISELRFR